MVMRSVTGFLLSLVFLVAGCASSGVDLIQPELRIAQLPGTSFSIRYSGRLTIRYALEIKNLSGETIQLERVRLRVIGDGPYTLQTRAVPAKKEIASETSEVVILDAEAYSYGGALAPDQPVTIRGIAYFDSPEGKFRTVFSQVVVQPDETGHQ